MPSPADNLTARARKKVFLAVMTALAVAISTLESTLPNPLPWVRLGLANAVTLLVLAIWGFREALGVTLSRVVLASLVSGGLLGPAFLLSLGGGLASVAVAGLLAQTGLFSLVGLSVAGSFVHTLTQFALLPLILSVGAPVLRLAPPFLLLSLPSGALVGWLVSISAQSVARVGGWGEMDGGLSMSLPPVILASASPRRASLLRALGVPFEVAPPGIDESAREGEEPREHVLRLAREKAAAVAGRFPGRIIVAADTTVVLDGRIFGKPEGREEARKMLRRLQGRTHQVLTGYALLGPDGRLRDGVELSHVTMKALTEEAVGLYLDTGEYRDKAGAYAAQGEAAGLIEKIEGSYTNVVGLPLPPLIGLLSEYGLRPLDPGLS